MNILIYDGDGCSAKSVSSLKSQLTTHLSSRYSVQSAGREILANEPWEEHTAALIIPGGRDLPYLAALKGRAITRIRNYVDNGGKYLGVCAGAYFACRSIAFAENDPELAIVGERPLQFIPGRAVGPTFSGFKYGTEEGAHLPQLTFYNVDGAMQGAGGVYLNGGCAFDLDSTHLNQGNVLARYSHDNSIAAFSLIHKNVVVTGLHPEFSLFDSPAKYLVEHEEKNAVEEMEQARVRHWRTLLTALNLSVKPLEEAKPEGLLPMALAGQGASAFVKDFCDVDSLQNLQDNPVTIHNDNGNDTLIIHAKEGFGLRLECDRIANEIDSKAPKHIYVFEDGEQNVAVKNTPKFDIERYFSNLHTRQCGRLLLYGEAVTSTQTILDKNLHLLRKCPSGMLALASHQLAGRGRGKNAWVSSSGCLQFSLVLRLDVSMSAHVIFVQYLLGLGIVQALKTFDKDLPVALKWPNDIYARRDDKWVKIGGILINSHFIDNQFTLVAGAGVNISNSEPTTCVNDLTATNVTVEEAAAAIMNRVEDMWTVFSKTGFAEYLNDYHDSWLHSDQLITLEETKQRVRVAGITADHGFLRTYPDHRCSVTPLADRYNPIDLQPDGNSFDMLAGLIKVKN